MRRLLPAGGVCAAAVMLFAGAVTAQDKSIVSVKATAAFAEVLLRKTELAAEIEAFAADHTDESPKMLDLRYEIAGLERYLAKMLALAPTDTSRLTISLGKLIVKRMSLDAELSRLSRTLNSAHPDFKRAQKRVAVFDAAIKEILP
jgi:hypothetical protein